MTKKKTKDKEKDKILEEISEKLKEIQNEEADEEPEKSELEEDVDLIEDSFSQFIPSLHSPEDTKIPVLERIASTQPRPVFVGGISQTPQTISGEEKKSDEFKYIPGQEGNNEPKYTESYAKISREPAPVDLIKAGRRPAEIIPQVDQEVFFRQSEQNTQSESAAIEKAWTPERNDFERAGRKDLFEAEQEKYKTYKPKLQKSY